MCKSSIYKTKCECKADVCACVCAHVDTKSLESFVCVCVCVLVTPRVTGSQRGGKESTDTLRSRRSVTPNCVWTVHSNTIFTFYSTFLKHPESSI